MFYRLYKVEPNWIIDTGRGSDQQQFDSVNLNGAVGVAQSGFDFTTFENAVLSIDGNVATLTQGS